MFVISKDSPAYYITSVTNNRLLVFQTAKLKEVVCAALNEVRTSADLFLFAYAVMPDHFHLLLGSSKSPSDVLRYVNGISGKRVIDYLKDGKFARSLQKLSREVIGERKHKYSLWDHHPNLKRVTDEGRVHAKSELHTPKSCSCRTDCVEESQGVALRSK